MNNPETLATLDTQYTGRRQTKHIGYTIHRTKTDKTQEHNTTQKTKNINNTDPTNNMG